MFAQLTSFKNVDQTEQKKPDFATEVEMPRAEELAVKQDVIRSLVILRYTEEENDFLHITEMTSFQRLELYTDTYPFLKLRKKLWLGYM